MKKEIKHYALTLLMCGTIASAWADGVDTNYIINEDFEEHGGGYQSSYHSWSLSGCKAGYTKNNKNVIINTFLRIENMGSGKNETSGYAITPVLNYEGNVYLSFKYAKFSDDGDLQTTIQNEGAFEGNGKSDVIPVENLQTSSFLTKSYKIFNVSNSTTIKFDKTILKVVYIDDVKIIKLGDLTLNETIDSSEPIDANNGTVCEVHTNRTLTGGIWNTMCLPFNVTKSRLESVLGANQDIQLRTYTGYANEVMTFEPATEVAAGTPFLIKLNTTVVNPAFTGDNKVTIVNTPAQSVMHSGVSFVGTYGPVDLKTDGSELFITKSNNKLSVPAATSNRMYGMRAFIQVSGGVFPARIVVGDDETTDLSTAIMAEEQDKKVYDLNGQQVMHPKKGLYIVNNRITFLK